MTSLWLITLWATILSVTVTISVKSFPVSFGTPSRCLFHWPLFVLNWPLGLKFHGTRPFASGQSPFPLRGLLNTFADFPHDTWLTRGIHTCRPSTCGRLRTACSQGLSLGVARFRSSPLFHDVVLVVQEGLHHVQDFGSLPFWHECYPWVQRGCNPSCCRDRCSHWLNLVICLQRSSLWCRRSRVVLILWYSRSSSVVLDVTVSSTNVKIIIKLRQQASRFESTRSFHHKTKTSRLRRDHSTYCHSMDFNIVLSRLKKKLCCYSYCCCWVCSPDTNWLIGIVNVCSSTVTIIVEETG